VRDHLSVPSMTSPTVGFPQVHLDGQTWEPSERKASAEEAYDAFYTLITGAMDVYFPVKTITIEQGETTYQTLVAK